MRGNARVKKSNQALEHSLQLLHPHGLMAKALKAVVGSSHVSCQTGRLPTPRQSSHWMTGSQRVGFVMSPSTVTELNFCGGVLLSRGMMYQRRIASVSNTLVEPLRVSCSQCHHAINRRKGQVFAIHRNIIKYICHVARSIVRLNAKGMHPAASVPSNGGVRYGMLLSVGYPEESMLATLQSLRRRGKCIPTRRKVPLRV